MYKPHSKSTVRFNKPRQNQVCIQQHTLIGLCLHRFNALLILDSPQTAQPTQASAFISTAVSYSQAGNTKTMETARMWHSEILLSRLVSLFLNKALHGVSSAHECCSLPFTLFPSLSQHSPFSSVYPLFFFSHWSLFISLYSSTQLASCLLYLCFCLFSSPLLLASSAHYPTADIVWKPLLSVWSDRCCSDFGYY